MRASEPTAVADEAVQILLVDDQPLNLDALEVMLASSSCQCVRTQSADQALMALLHQEFAAIVLDIKMPGMSGLELASLIKQRKRTQHIPILFLTAHMLDDRDMLRGYGTGAVDHLTKPVNPDILRSKIAGFVELFRKTRALARANEALQREIAQRELTQEALRQLNQELEIRVQERTAALEDAVRARDDFLSIASHELRNPINAIQLQLLSVIRAAQRNGDSPTREWIVDRIGRATAQVGRITRLLDNLLDVSRLTTGRLDLEPEDVDFGVVVHTVVELFRAELDGRQVTVRATEAIGHWDRLRLEQIVMNLLSNAIKYGNGKPIEISLEVDGGWARLSVTDHGIGIDAENQKRLFGRFERAVSGLQYGGFGLGLWITLQIIDNMGGQIAVDSQPGEGSTFSVTLPLAPSPTVERRGGEPLVT